MRYVASLLPLVVVLAIACEDGQAQPTPTPTPAPTATATAAAAAPAEVQAIVDAALSGDPEQIEPLVGYTKIGCIITPQGIGQPPLCREGEGEGTPVDVLWVAACEGGYLRSDELDDTLGMLSDLEFFAAYRWPQALNQPPVEAEYAGVFSRTGPAGETLAVELLIQEGQVVSIKFGCGESPKELVDFEGLKEVVLPPPGP